MRSSNDSQTAQPLRIGTLLDGRYRIDSVLGKGAMACVYLAEHVGLGRTVAIKVLRADVGGSQDAAKRFKREALASGRLVHPNVVGVSDFGVLEDGSAYLVMEALTGESLGDRLTRERRIPWREAVEVMRGILRGLAHAHERGVVHRDIKPDNIFLATQDGRSVVKLLDFGIAKLVAGISDDPAATRTGITMGTPAYLSPEQAVGSKITAAADLYSATVVLFEMLTGHTVFEESDLVAMMTAHVNRPPPALAAVAPDLAVPPRLEELVQRGLRKRVAERIGSAAEYLELLDGIEPEPEPPPEPPALLPDGVAGQSIRRPTSVGGEGAPIPRSWLVGGGIVLGGALVVALIAAALGDDGSAGEDGRAVTAPRPAPDGPPLPPPLPEPPATAAAARDVQLKALLYDLQEGRACPERRAVIPKLVELDDPRAIPALKAARYRLRGNQANTNECLRKDAEAAIKTLGRPR